MLHDLILFHQKRLDAAQSVLDTDGNLYTHEQRASAQIETAQEREHLRQLKAAQGKLGIANCPRFRHKIRGGTYVEMDIAIAQCAATIHDNDPVTVYRGTDGQLYVRPSEEFGDGRFEALDDIQPLREYERRGRHKLRLSLRQGSEDAWVYLLIGDRVVPWSFSADAWNAMLRDANYQFSIDREQTEDASLHGDWRAVRANCAMGMRTELFIEKAQ